MALTVYSGLMGSGKSYEVVKNVLLPNLASGRNVVTNIAGLESEKIQSYIHEHYKIEPDKQGSITTITQDDVDSPSIYPNDSGEDSILKSGDILVLDECWRWFASGVVLADHHMTFIRMHRHFTHSETGISCDIVLIVQSVGDLQRKVRAVVEKTFLMRKLKDLGLDKRYSVTVFGGSRTTKASQLEQSIQKYDPLIFPLYSSYSQSTAVTNSEKSADSRGTIFNSFLFKYGIPLSLALCVPAFWYIYHFFHPEQKTESHDQAQSSSISPAISQSPPTQKVPSLWRVVGRLSNHGDNIFLVTDGKNTKYIKNPPLVHITEFMIELQLPDGQIASSTVEPYKPSKDSIL